MLRGNHPARVDDKGRIKVPNGFRTLIESQYGAELFVTSVTGDTPNLPWCRRRTPFMWTLPASASTK